MSLPTLLEPVKTSPSARCDRTVKSRRNVRVSETRDVIDKELKVVSENPGFVIFGLERPAGLWGVDEDDSKVDSMYARGAFPFVDDDSPDTISKLMACGCLPNFSRPLPVVSSLMRNRIGFCDCSI